MTIPGDLPKKEIARFPMPALRTNTARLISLQNVKDMAKNQPADLHTFDIPKRSRTSAQFLASESTLRASAKYSRLGNVPVIAVCPIRELLSSSKVYNKLYNKGSLLNAQSTSTQILRAGPTTQAFEVIATIHK